MELDALKEALQAYFSDTSRSPQETANGLLEVADMAVMFADSIGEAGGDDDHAR